MYYRIAQKYNAYLNDFETHLPLIRAMRTQGLRQRHWGRIYQDMPHLQAIDKSMLTLHTILQVGLMCATFENMTLCRNVVGV